MEDTVAELRVCRIAGVDHLWSIWAGSPFAVVAATTAVADNTPTAAANRSDDGSLPTLVSH